MLSSTSLSAISYTSQLVTFGVVFSGRSDPRKWYDYLQRKVADVSGDGS